MIAVSAQLIYSRWVRLGTALVASVLLDWLGDQLVLLKSPPPSSRLLDWLLAPGVYLGLRMSGAHGNRFMTIVWIVTTLIVAAVLYALFSVVVWTLDRARRSAYDDRKTA